MKIDNRNIFQQIGNLFYAIATDQYVKPAEAGKLKSLISKEWLPRNLNESYVSDETHFILLAMDSLEGSRATSQNAFSEFSKFYTLHHEVFTKEVKQRILNTAIEITNIFKVNNPFNNPRLMALRELLNPSGKAKVYGNATIVHST